MARRPKETLMLSDAIHQYLIFREASGMGTGTVVRNRSVLNSFLAVAGAGCPGGDINVESIKVDHLTAWRVSRMATSRGRPLRGNTQNSDGATIRTFFKWLLATARFHGPDPTVYVKSVKVMRHDFIRILPENWGEMLDAATRPRDRFLLAITLYTFARASEVRTLTVADAKSMIDGKMGIKLKRYKTVDQDVIPVSTELADELGRWLKWYQRALWAQGTKIEDSHMLVPRLRADVNTSVQDPITGKFVKSQGLDPLTSPVRAETIVKPILTEMGYATNKEGMHTLRRSAATALYYELLAREEKRMLPTGVRAIEVVSDMLGHSSLEITWDYIGLKMRRSNRDSVIGGQPMFQLTGPARKADLSAVSSIG